MTEKQDMGVVTQPSDVYALVELDGLDWLSCDGRPNPKALDILRRHRLASQADQGALTMDDIKRAHDAGYEAALDHACPGGPINYIGTVDEAWDDFTRATHPQPSQKGPSQ